ncbi:MAG: hypothetical protein AB7G21_10375 [Dehalococcoidia bacterium]
MTSEEGVPHGDTGTGFIGDQGRHEEPAWAEPAQQMKQMREGGWWATMLAAAGSLATVIGAVLLARRRSKRNRVIAAMPSTLADASEQVSDQVMRSREQLMRAGEQFMHGRKQSRRNPIRALAALGAVALAGWGLRRTMAQQG